MAPARGEGVAALGCPGGEGLSRLLVRMRRGGWAGLVLLTLSHLGCPEPSEQGLVLLTPLPPGDSTTQVGDLFISCYISPRPPHPAASPAWLQGFVFFYAPRVLSFIQEWSKAQDKRTVVSQSPIGSQAANAGVC